MKRIKIKVIVLIIRIHYALFGYKGDLINTD